MSVISERVARIVFQNPDLLDPAQLITRAAGTFDNYGDFIPGAETATLVDVVTAPITGEERQILEEGIRTRDIRKFWLTQPVSAGVEGEDNGDIIRYDGTEYRAQVVDDWDGFLEVTAIAIEQ